MSSDPAAPLVSVPIETVMPCSIMYGIILLMMMPQAPRMAADGQCATFTSCSLSSATSCSLGYPMCTQ